MKRVNNSEILQGWLLESGYLGQLWDHARFSFDEGDFDQELAGVRLQYPHLSEEEAEARVALRLLGKEQARRIAASARASRGGRLSQRERILVAVVVALLTALTLLVGALRTRAAEKRPTAGTQKESQDLRGPKLLMADHGMTDLTANGLEVEDRAGFRSGLLARISHQGALGPIRKQKLARFEASETTFLFLRIASLTGKDLRVIPDRVQRP